MFLNMNNNKNLNNATLIKNQKMKSKKTENIKTKKIKTINNILNPCYATANNKQYQIKTEKISPATIHNKIINQLNNNEKNIPKVIFNLNSNNYVEVNYINNNSSNNNKQTKDSKSNSKTKSDNKKKIITN